MTDSSLPDYPNSPVTEAVIEVKVEYEVNSKDMHIIVKNLKQDYPHAVTVQDIGIAQGTKPTLFNERFQLSSHDQLDYAVITSNGVAVTRHAPYLGWDTLQKHFAKTWKLWKDVARTQKISRIGARNINRIDIPCKKGETIRVEDYLTFYPKIPRDNDPIDGYLIQVTKPIKNTSWSVLIVSTQTPSPLINCVSCFLDIDVFRTDDGFVNESDLFDMLAEARDIKNTVFQECITAKTMGLYSHVP